MTNPALDLSVVICTRNRDESLQETLRCLAASPRAGWNVEIVVIDNGRSPDTRRIAESFQGEFPVRYFREEAEGKGNSLNRALAAGGLGRIVAGLDDDMSPEPDWFQEVRASCERHPEVDVFGGHVYIIWPEGQVPIWAKKCRADVRTWALSAFSEQKFVRKEDRILRRDRFPCGNHFWFRSARLNSTSRFGHLWVPEPRLFLDFMEQGSVAMVCTAVIAGHRLQPGLLDETMQFRRAAAMGHNFATDAMRPFRPSLRVPRAFHRRPVLTRGYCVAMLVRYGLMYLAARVGGSRDEWAERRIHATERLAFFRVLLEIAAEDAPYQVLRR